MNYMLIWIWTFPNQCAHCTGVSRSWAWRRYWKHQKEAKGRRASTFSFWFGYLQDAWGRVGLKWWWEGPGKIDINVERCRFMAKAAQCPGPAPWLQLLHRNSPWLEQKKLLIYALSPFWFSLSVWGRCETSEVFAVLWVRLCFEGT